MHHCSGERLYIQPPQAQRSRPKIHLQNDIRAFAVAFLFSEWLIVSFSSVNVKMGVAVVVAHTITVYFCTKLQCYWSHTFICKKYNSNHDAY